MIFDFRFMLLVLLSMKRVHCLRAIMFCLVLSLSAGAQNKYRLHYVLIDKDTTFHHEISAWQTLFDDEAQGRQYIAEAIEALHKKGFIAASADSMSFDSAGGRVWIYAGRLYRWIDLNTDNADQQMLASVGWDQKLFHQAPLDFGQIQRWQERFLHYYEDNGYPFARVIFDSLLIGEKGISARLITEKGPLYKIDSIRVYGNVKISDNFLQRYLSIENGSVYRKSRLQAISGRLAELPYLKEIKTWDLTMTGAGSVLNLYMDTKKSSQIDVLIGFLPATGETGRTKLQLTGEANINLKNALGSGETIGVNWQQIQVKSPRLQLKYEHSFVFRTPFGFDFDFDFLKKDSSFLNLSAQLGIQYLMTEKQSGKVFFQTFFTNVLPAGVDTQLIKSNVQLPSFADVTSNNIGLQYTYNNTDYRMSPRRGNELNLTGSVGLRKIKPNASVTGIKNDTLGNDFDYRSLYDSLNPRTYLLKFQVTGAHYFKTGKQSVLKTGVRAASMITRDIFRNEMYQIGGYRLLRGFDEESIYAGSYAVFTAEYRLFIGLNSYFFGFVDGGWVRDNAYCSTQKRSHSYVGTGLGMAFETKAGIFNLSYAVGKRDDMPVDFRQSKIHFGLMSLF